MKYYAIIVAGGSGKRMQHTTAKQFLLLKNKPVLMHTLAAFHDSVYRPELIVVLPPDLHGQWQTLCTTYHCQIPHQVVSGGDQRFHSVRNGLMTIKEDGIVAVHDAVRPLVSTRLINAGFEGATLNGNAIPYIIPNDSVRRLKTDDSKIMNRDSIALIQTPQVFESNQLKTAYQQHYHPRFTDDASVVEEAGFKINLVEGERHNLKITYPEDLELAHFLVK